MPGPIDSLRFVHAAILEEAKRIDEACARASKGEDLGTIADGVQWWETLNEYHTRGEELGLFPVLAQRAPQIDVTYLLDHELERSMFVEFREAIAKGECAAASRLAAQVRHHLSTHIEKENTLILPYVAENFSPAEQAEMVGKIISTIPQGEMARAVPWIIARLTLDMAAAYTGAVASVMPPPAFEVMKGAIREGIPADMWAALKERVPALASA